MPQDPTSTAKDRILWALKNKGRLTVMELEKEIGLNHKTVGTYLSELRKLKFVEYTTVWDLTDKLKGDS